MNVLLRYIEVIQVRRGETKGLGKRSRCEITLADGVSQTRLK